MFTYIIIEIQFEDVSVSYNNSELVLTLLCSCSVYVLSKKVRSGKGTLSPFS